MRKLLFLVFIFVLLLALFPATGVQVKAQQRPDAPTYARRGPYAVGTQELALVDEERPLKVTIWYPALNPRDEAEVASYEDGLLTFEGQALRDALPNLKDASYPLVIFSHGLGGFRWQSLFYTEHLASHGFVVMATDHPGSAILDVGLGASDDEAVLKLVESFAYRPLEVLRLLALAEGLNESGEFAGMIDTERTAVTGHSFGGYTTVAVGGAQINSETLTRLCQQNEDTGEAVLEEGVQQACETLDIERVYADARGLDDAPEGLWPPTTDSRIKALVPLAPGGIQLFGEEGVTGVQLPMLVVVGSGDTVTPPAEDAFVLLEEAQSAEKYLVVLEYANHYIFVDECGELALRVGFFESCSDDVWDMARAHDLINHFATAFLRVQLYDDAEAAQALESEAVDFPAVRYEVTK